MPRTEHICNLQQQSIYRVSRELKKEQHSLFNCLSSICDDSAFCTEIRVLYPDLPLLANLRCGLWYAPRPEGVCYFKSTDGHQGNHQFSTTRLNWHVAELAARRGGCIIVDATRKGKRFPDAMSKTIPVWACVINRAVARVRLHDAQKEQRRRSYTTLDGDVLTPVADTQTCISVRDEEPSCSASSSPGSLPASTLAAEAKAEAVDTTVLSTTCSSAGQGMQPAYQSLQLLQQPQQPLEGCAQQQQQQPAASQGPVQSASSHCSCSTQQQLHEVEELLVDCMADSMELLSGLTVNMPHRPNTPDLHAAHKPGGLHMQSGGSTAAALDWSPSSGTPVGSPTARASTLPRSFSLQISPQPSLQEWLDEADVLYRLSLLHECRSPAKRTARISCHSIGNSNSGDFSLLAGGDVLLASSAPAISCLLGGPPQRSSCSRALYRDTPAAMQPRGASESAAGAVPAAGGEASHEADVSGFTLTGGPAAEPVTPRLGCCGALPAAFDSIHEALQCEAAAAAAAVGLDGAAGAGSAGLTSHQLHLLEQQHEEQWGVAIPCGGRPPTVGSAVSVIAGDAAADGAADTAADFAFPHPHLLAHSAGGSSLPEGSSAAAAGPGTGSSCGCSGLPLPEMPVVVLNGNSHIPGDAASILDIWRNTDLEDVATLPRISDFKPGVYHLSVQEGDEETELACGHQFGCEWLMQTQQQQEGGTAGQIVGDSADVELCSQQQVQECSRRVQQADAAERSAAASKAAAAAAVAASVASSTESSSSWLDEETGVGYDGLCAFATPAAAGDDSSSACSASSTAVVWPGSPSACSSCSADSGSGSKAAAAGTAAAAGGAAAAAAADTPWDTSLHLPLWVSDNERQAIEAKLDGFVERLLEVGADVRGLAARLDKPLRPLWVSQDSLIWTNQVAHPSTLSFTPLLLVSASQPHQGERQAARAAWQLPYSSNSTFSPGCFDAGRCDLDDLSDDEEPSISSSKATKLGRGKGGSKSGGGGSLSQPGHGPDSQALSSWSYVYVPGAGDDEESWAAGLSPTLFWDNCAALLSCGPAGIASAVKQLLQHHKSMAFTSGTASSQCQQLQGRQLHQQLQLQRAVRPCAGPLADKHHPAPKGCGGEPGLLGDCATVGLKVVRAAPGAFWLGSTGLALGNLEGASAADVWRTVDAVLCCGTQLSPALLQEYQAMQLSTVRTPAVSAATADAFVTVCSSSAAPVAGSAPGLGLCFKPTHLVSAPISSSYSVGCSNSQPFRQQQGASPAADSDNAPDVAAGEQQQCQLDYCKLDVAAPAPVAAGQRTRRKGGMLTELLGQAKAAQQAAGGRAGEGGAHHARSGSADSISSCSSSTSDGSGSSDSGSSDTTADSNCSSSYYSTCSDDAAASSAAPAGRGGVRQSLLPRLKWLPIEAAKRDKFSLKQHMQEALEFVTAHLAAGHLVLLHDLEGHDNCVCVAIAALLGCFTPPEAADAAGSPAAAQGASCEPRFVAAWQADGQLDAGELEQQYTQQLVPPAPVSKHSVRQRLALVSSCYPAARPTRASLKQVFNFFEERRRSTGVGQVYQN